MDVDKLDDAELEALQDSVASELRKRANKRKADARRQITEIASKHGINLAELTAANKPGEKSAAKYRDPDNQFNTWTGRGRKPAWLEAQLKAGKTLEQMAIAQ
jgi:DNA-binding protein H-NS